MKIDISTVQEISKVFTNNAFLSTQNDLRTEYFRKKAFSEMFDFVQPVCYKLGFNKEKKKCHYQYVPILETIKSLFKDDSIREQYLNPPESKTTYFDFYSGSVYKNNSFFPDEKALKTILFQDAFEIVNPLGAARGKYKILAVYI